jgi:ribosome-associated protein
LWTAVDTLPLLPVPRKPDQALSDPAATQDDDSRLVSRTDLRRDERRRESTLLALATRLAGLKPAQLDRLGLTDPQLEIIDELRVIESAAARSRALKRLRAALREADLPALGMRMNALSDPKPSAPDEAIEWRARLIEGTDADLNAFVLRFPGADRAQLRMLARRAARAKPSEQARASYKLEQALRAAMRA